jgi:hypothetical protein
MQGKKIALVTVKRIAIGAVIAASALAVTTCSQDSGGSGGSGGGCKGDGACYYIKANNDYKWCGDESCAVWLSEDKGQQSLSCDCD